MPARIDHPCTPWHTWGVPVSIRPYSILKLQARSDCSALHCTLVRGDLARDDIRVEGHRSIAGRADLDSMAARGQIERLPRRRKLPHPADARAIHEHLRGRRRHLEA